MSSSQSIRVRMVVGTQPPMGLYSHQPHQFQPQPQACQPQPHSQTTNIHNVGTPSPGVGSHQHSSKRRRASTGRNNDSDSLAESIKQMSKVLEDKAETMKNIATSADPAVSELEKAFELLGKIDGLNEGDNTYVHCMNVLMYKLK